jgi:Calx-beta domain/Domain of unknown function (DUF4114)
MATVASTGLNALLNETGKIYLSVDGKGTASADGTVRVLKNAGATVRKAYLVGDSTNVEAVSAAVNNTAIAWDRVETTPWQGGTFYSYRTDVTSILKPIVDAAAAGTLNIPVSEGIGSPYEGLALAIVFDDPNQAVDQSVILYFGGLKPTGATATINFATPVNTSATLGATFGLGIGYSFNGLLASQTSQVQVNGQLLTSVAGNYDDGSTDNGTLFTIGGIGDSPNNPDPASTDYTKDDELYNLLPFIKNGDTALTLNTVNPSNDDHIFFAHLTLQGITATDSANVVKLAVAPSSVTEDGTGKLVYTFTRTGATTNPLTVGYQVGGTATLTTDYAQTGAASFTATTGTVTFAAGANTATVTLSPVADTVIEPDETIFLTLNNGDGYAVGTSAAVTGTILNDDLLPIISIAAGVNAAEPATNGTFILTRTGDLAAALTVNLAAPTGTAAIGVDYTAIATTATFAVGSATATVNVATIDDTIVEPTETISLALAAGTGYTLGATTAASINLTDNDVAPIVLPSITIASGVNAAEPATNGTFTLTRTGDLAAALTVNLAVPTGTATSGTDYTTLGTTATFAVGSATATVNVAPIDDTLIEPTETISLALAAGAGYTLGTTTAVSINLTDNDVAPPVIVLPVVTIASGIDAAEPATNGSFTLTRTGDLAAALTVNLAASTGSATSGVDYTAFAPTVTFAAGSATATVNVLTIDDLLVEPIETVGLVLAAGTGYTLGAVPNAPIDLVDNDVAVAPPQLEEKNNHCLHIKGGRDKSVLKFTKSNHQGKNKNQVCAFVVDDATGKIGGINPGHKDYLAAAIDRAQVVFSSLSDRPIDSGFDRDSQRHLNFKSGEHVEFMMIADDSLSRVKTDLAANKTPTNVLFSIPEANGDSSSPAKFTALPDGGYQIDWEDGATETTASMPDFNDMVMRVQVLNDLTTPAGIDIQNQSQGSVMDFRSSAGKTLKVDTKCESDAAYNNNIGFYAVEDSQGTLANGLKPGDMGYAEAAIKGAVLRCFKTDVKTDLALEGGKIYAPVVIANGTFEDYLKNNPQNQANSDVHAYFNFIGANTDKVDHFRLLGDNKFGVEDFYGGGDKDYNDIVFQMNIKG